MAGAALSAMRSATTLRAAASTHLRSSVRLIAAVTTPCACGRRGHSTLAAAAAPSRVDALRLRISEELPELGDFVGGGTPPELLRAPAERSEPLRRREPRLVRNDAPAIAPELVDRYARRHTYLRISLTERCSLRCTYCMPEEGVQLTAADKLLSRDEILRLASTFVHAGVTKIRLTGGEQTVRRDLLEIVSGLDDLRGAGLREIAMTSNGIALPRMLPRLHAAGLDRLNVSLDTLDRSLFTTLTRRDGLGRVLSAIDKAVELGYAPLKVNCVLMAGVNEHELLDFAALALERPIDVSWNRCHRL